MVSGPVLKRFEESDIDILENMLIFYQLEGGM
jgi:hypothetical protein